MYTPVSYVHFVCITGACGNSFELIQFGFNHIFLCENIHLCMCACVSVCMQDPYACSIRGLSVLYRSSEDWTR